MWIVVCLISELNFTRALGYFFFLLSAYRIAQRTFQGVGCLAQWKTSLFRPLPPLPPPSRHIWQYFSNQQFGEYQRLFVRRLLGSKSFQQIWSLFLHQNSGAGGVSLGKGTVLALVREDGRFGVLLSPKLRIVGVD